MQRILALDLDGTSVDDQGNLGRKSVEAIRAAQQRNWLVCFVSGRREIDMLYMDDSWRVADYMILNNGGKIIRVEDDAVLHNVYINKTDALELLTHCLTEDLQIYAVNGTNWWVNRENDSGRAYAETLGSYPTLFSRATQLPYDRIEGFMVTEDGDAVGAWIAEQCMRLEVLPSEPGCIDVMEAGVSKDAGLRKLAELLNLSLAGSVAVGNYSNDIDMLRCAEVSVAVASALDEVKDIADYITVADHNQDAVAEVVERFILC